MARPQAQPQGDLSARVGVVLVRELLPFVYPDFSCDLRFGTYLTGELCRVSLDPLVKAIYQSLTAFFEELDRLGDLAESGDVDAAAEFSRRLSFGERREAGIGYVRDGHSGSASGRRVTGALLRNALLAHPALRKVLTRQPDALYIIPRFDMDRVGDAMLNIALREFAEYTHACATEYGFSRESISPQSYRNVWNRHTRQFDALYKVELPTDFSGRPLLLLPREMTRGTPPFLASDFIDDEAVTTAGVRERLKKSQLLERLGLDVEKLERFVMARFVGLAPGQRFQGEVKRRRKPRS